MKRIALIITILLLFSNNLFAATLEVGTGKTYTTIQLAVDEANSGDTVLVYPGTYPETITTQRDNIIIKAVYPAVTETDQTKWATINGEYSRALAFYILHNYTTIDGFHITQHFHTILYQATITTRKTWEGHETTLTVGHIIQNNFIEKTKQISNFGDADISFYNVQDGLIRFNKLHGIGSESPNGGILLRIASGENIIEFNEMHGYQYPYAHGYTMLNRSHNTIVRYNYIYDNILGIYSRDSNYTQIYGNLIVDNSKIQIFTYQDVKTYIYNKIFNNTLVSNTTDPYNFRMDEKIHDSEIQQEWQEMFNNVIIRGYVAYGWYSNSTPVYFVTHGNVYYNFSRGFDEGRLPNERVDLGGEVELTASDPNPLDSDYLSLPPYEYKGANLDVSVWPYQVVRQPLRIDTVSLADGLTNTAYSQTLAASEGETPYSWTIKSGSFPAGLTLNQTTGEISGTPTTVEAQAFTIKVTDSSSPETKIATMSFNINITPPPPLKIDTTSFEDGLTNIAYSQALAASEGETHYSWTLETGILPAGLTLNQTTGEISGTPTTVEAHTFTIKVTDSSTPESQTATKELNIAITKAPTPLYVSFSSILSWAPSQDKEVNNYEVLDNGTTLHMWGNNWKAIEIVALEIYSNSYLEFDFKSDGEKGETNGILLDTDLMMDDSTDSGHHFQVYGTQYWGKQDYHNYSGTDWIHYTIPIGEKFTGSFVYLVFTNDADAGQNTDVYYRNIKITPYYGEDTTAPTTTASPAGGTYSSTQSVTLTADEAATIYYTTDGSTPTASSSTYSTPTSISASTTLKFFAKDAAGNQESIKPEVYVIITTPPLTPTNFRYQ